MTLRSLLFFSTSSLVVMTGVHGESLPNEVATPDQTNTATAKPSNQEPPVKQAGQAHAEKKKGPPPMKEIKTIAPFVLKGGFARLPTREGAKVKLFEGEGAFREYADVEGQTVWPIGKFASAAIPADEPGFRQVLRAHGGKLGADYVVLITDTTEIKRLFPAKIEELVYCAMAYKRVTARLGIERDQDLAKDKVTKISGFTPGSRAEASGLRIGDILKKVEGQVPGASEIYWSKAVRWNAGDKVKVEFERDGKTLELEVELTAG